MLYIKAVLHLEGSDGSFNTNEVFDSDVHCSGCIGHTVVLAPMSAFDLHGASLKSPA